LVSGSLQEKPQASMVNRQLSINDSETFTTHSPFTIHHSQLKHAPKIFTDTCKIDFSKTVEEVHNLIRGLSPFPGAFTMFNEKVMKIYKSKKELTTNPPQEVGAFETDGKTFLKFACSSGYVQVLELQLEGKKKMLVEDFLRGYRS
jgi:methionyl-tRNA formyltransferase